MSTLPKLSAKEIDRISRGLPPWESMSFACGGWLQFYMFGVAKALQECGLQKDVKYLGCSAGSLAAVGLCIDGNFDDAIKFCKEYCLPKAYGEVTGLFKLSEYVSMCIELCVLPYMKDIPPENLQIAVTRLPFLKAERVTVHKNSEELVLSLLASCAAFPLSPIVYRNSGWYIDGGLSDFQPVLDDETITVSPFYFSDCHIKPSRYIPLWWTFLPPKSGETVDWIYNLGFDDCIRFIRSKGLPVKLNGKYRKRDVEHPYNEPGRVSMHRFLGYDVKSLTNHYIAFIADALLLILLILVWKPLALLLIYIELFCRMVVLAIFTLIDSVWELFPHKFVQSLAQKAYVAAIPDFIGVAFLRKHALNVPKLQRIKIMQELWECTTCIGSLSLLLRFVSGPPNPAELRKHNRLAKHSILYRVFRHII